MPLFNKNNKKEVNAVENVFTNKIFVLPERATELEKLQSALLSNPTPIGPCTILGVNLSPDVERALVERSGLAVMNECITEEKEDKKKFSKLWKPGFLEEKNIGAVFIELRTPHLDSTARRTFALSVLAQLPVLGIVRMKQVPVEDQARDYSGGTWPVFQLCEGGKHTVDDILAWLSQRLPHVRRIKKGVYNDLMERCKDLGEINPAKHFMKRASVALIPFGVATVNFLGIVRLMAEMMVRSGMATDEEAKKAVKMIMAKGGAQTAAVDALGDVYQFAIVATVLSDGINNAVDAIMLGSTAVVTGAISAVGAYYSRPKIVKAAVEFLSSLQIIYVLNPTMRRQKSCVTGTWMPATGYVIDSANEGGQAMAHRPASDVEVTQGGWGSGYSQLGGPKAQRPASASVVGATQGSWAAGPPQVTWLGAPPVQPSPASGPGPASGHSAAALAHPGVHGSWQPATPHGTNVTWLGAPQSQPVCAPNMPSPAPMQSSPGYPVRSTATATVSQPAATGVQGQWGAPVSASYSAYNQGSWAPAPGGQYRPATRR